MISHNLRKTFTSQAIPMILTFYKLEFQPQTWYLTPLYLSFETPWVIMRALHYFYQFCGLFIHCCGGKLQVLRIFFLTFLLRLICLSISLCFHSAFKYFHYRLSLIVISYYLLIYFNKIYTLITYVLSIFIIFYIFISSLLNVCRMVISLTIQSVTVFRLFSFYLCLFLVPKSQKPWSTSFIPKTAMLSTFNNFPWIVPIDETCQGIMLNQWWILSTISCLTKLWV